MAWLLVLSSFLRGATDSLMSGRIPVGKCCVWHTWKCQFSRNTNRVERNTGQNDKDKRQPDRVDIEAGHIVERYDLSSHLGLSI